MTGKGIGSRALAALMTALLALALIGARPARAEVFVRFVQISDVHLNPRRGDVRGRMISRSLDLLEDAVARVNAMEGVDFVVFTGDMIDGPTEALLNEFARAANKLDPPWFWAVGNHDIGPGGLDREAFRQGMNRHNPYIQPETACYAFLAGGAVFFFMDGASDDRITAEGWFSPQCLGFLDESLAAHADRPAVIFQHFPLSPPFASKTHNVRNRDEYLSVIGRRPNVKALFTGHYHAARIRLEQDLLHVAAPALVQYPNAFRVVTMRSEGGSLRFEIALVETGLGAVQEQSRRNSSSATLHAGSEADRNAVVTIPLP